MRFGSRPLSSRLLLFPLLALGPTFGPGAASPGPASTRENAPASPSRPEILHVQNAGVSVRWEDRAVLIDALVDLHEAPGTPPRPFDKLAIADLERLVDGSSAVGCVDLVLVTHRHPDHFCTTTTQRYLETCPDVIVLTPDAIDHFDPIDRFEGLRSLPIGFGTSDTMTVAGIPLTVLGLRHVSSGDAASPVPHAGYVLRPGSWKVAHLGDAQGSPDDLALVDRALAGSPAILLVPYWFLDREDSRAWLRERPPTDVVILLHVDPWRRERVEGLVAELRTTIPGLLLPGRHLEAIAFPSDAGRPGAGRSGGDR